MEKQPKNRNLRFNVQLCYEQQPQEGIELIGFLFNCRGRLLQKQFADDNQLLFDLKESKSSISLDQVRLFVAPATDKRILSVTSLAEMESYKAYEPILNSVIEGNVAIEPIPEFLSQYWLYCKCRVKGNVKKWFNTGGVWDNKAVCNARVHICEIDPLKFWIQKIPDHIIAKIPEAILKPERLVRVPELFPDPPPFNHGIQSRQLPQISENIFATISPQERGQQIAAKLPEISPEVKQTLASGNLNAIRQTLLHNYTILHPWFCFWPWWWPYFYRCKELAVVKTNSHGRFDTSVTYNCFGDKPDIYVWVEYFINGEWTTVYRPPIPCNTRWNYDCGSDINIQITDERVPGDCCCSCPIAGSLVFVRTVSRRTSVSHIRQTPQQLQPPGQSVPYERIGLTDATAIGDPGVLASAVDDYRRPFGGSPSLFVGFGSDLPNNNIYYYRWSYRKTANADLSPVADSYKPLIPNGGVMNKGYDFEYQDSNNDTQIGTDVKKLGPFSQGGNDHLYIIPPQQPTMPPFSVAAASSPLWHEQTYNMNTMGFDSTNLNGGDGLYEFKLELFNKAGVILEDLDRTDTFKIPQHDNAGLSRNAPDAYLEDPTGDIYGGTADAFNMLMRFDNQKCEAEIFTVNVNGLPASLDCCGFVNYKPDGVEADLEITFEATQPNNFAVFSFGVHKGTCGSVGVANANGMVIDDSASGYVLNSGIYSKHFKPEHLLGECYENGEGKAAFGQNLHVYTMATDGYARVNRDATDNAAFALEP